MRLTILGSGTAVPVADRFPAGVLVQSGGTTVLVDCGPGTSRRLPAAGVGLEQLDAVLLTHYHTDHSADLTAILFGLRNPRYRGRPPLRIFGAPGLRAFHRHLCDAWPWLDPKGGYDLELTEVDPGAFTVGSLAIVAVPIQHTAQSLAYRLTDAEGRSAAISGDADVCPGLVEVARDVDLFVCEASFPDDGRIEGHLTPRLAAEAATAAGARHLCLTHFYPECEGTDLAAQARAAYSGRITLATDLAAFEL